MFLAEIVAAPAATGNVGHDIGAIAISQLAYPVVGFILALITYLTHFIQKKLAADTKKTTLDWAVTKLTEFTDIGIGRLWAAMQDDVQKVFADGEITHEEMDFLKAEAQKHLKEMFTPDTLAKIAAGLGIPVDNLGGWVAGYIVKRFFPSMVASVRDAPSAAAAEVTAGTGGVRG